MARKKEYNDDSISSLKGAEQVRYRPAVIFGSDGIEGCEHSAFEIISNSIDEAREGFGNKIVVTMYSDNSIEVEDFGRGIPVGYNKKEEKFNWELLFCTLYAGGKYNNLSGDTYEYSLGLNGLGLASTQFASEYMDAEIKRDGKKYTIHFEKGKPTALDGKAMKASTLLKELNAVGGANGIGIIDIVENRLVGMKSRGVYETPGGTILYKAHEVLETLTLDKLTAHKKRELAITFGELVYDGQWFSPLRKALSAFVTSTQEHVTGKVRLELYKGNLINAGVWSPYSLYREDIATFAAGGDYKQSDATGFISIYGLPTKVQAIVNSEKEGL